MRILIADDSALSRMILERIVSNLNLDCEIVLARDGKEARDLAFEDDTPAVIFLDWMMPKIDGIDLCKIIRDSDISIQPYIFLMSARDSKRDIAQGLNAGANDYLTKPYDETELDARLRVGVRMYKLQRSLADQTEALASARQEISQLQKLLPVCTRCKKISPEDTDWRRIAAYVDERTDISVDSVVCPNCKTS